MPFCGLIVHFYHWSQRLLPWEIQLHGSWSKWKTSYCIISADICLKCTASHEKQKWSDWVQTSQGGEDWAVIQTDSRMGGRKEPVNRVLKLKHLPAMLGVEDSIIPRHEHAPCPPQPGQNLYSFFLISMVSLPQAGTHWLRISFLKIQ